MRILHTITILAFLMVAHISEAQPVFNMSQHTAQQGQTVTVDVTVESFTDINSASFAVGWNDQVIAFQQLANLNQDLDVTLGSFSIVGGMPVNSDRLDFLVFAGATNLNAADGDILFSIVFELIGQPCSESDVIFRSGTTSIEIIQNDIDVTEVSTFNNGKVSIDGTDCNGGGSGELEFFGTTEFAGPGDMVCVGVGVRGFNNVAAVQFSQNWNPNLLSFVELRNFNLPGMNASNFGTGQTGNGALSFSYNPAPDPISVPDNTIIYEICYEVTGSIGQTANISFSSSPILIDVVVEVGGVPESVTPKLSPGRVIIEGEFDGLTFLGEDIIGPLGQTVCMDVSVSGFDNILGIQDIEFQWDPNSLEYSSISTVDLPSEFGENDLFVNEGRLNWFWVDLLNANGVSLPDNTVILSLCFNVIGECDETIPVLIVGRDNGEIMAFDGDDNNVPAIGITGSIQVECDCNIDATVSNVSCFGGSDGAISLELSALCTPFESLIWTSDATDIPAGTINPTGLAAGSYTVVITHDFGETELTINITEPSEIIIDNIDISLPDPPGTGSGSITLEVSGGTGNLTFEWSNGASGSTIENLESGTYQVTITDENGCELVDEIIVCGIPATPEVDNVTCFGFDDGSIIFIFDGDDSNIQFNWSCDAGNTGPVATGLAPGECTVIVTDTEANCSLVFEFEITEPEAALTLESSTVVDDDEGTNAGSISVNISGGTPPYTYNWGPGNLPNTPNLQNIGGGAYTLEVVDANGCVITQNFQVGGALELGANIIHVACRGEASGSISLNVAGGSGNYSYQWICDGGQSGTEFSISNLSAGTCRVLVTDNESGVQVEEEYVINQPATDLVFEIMSLECNEETNRADLTLVASGGVAPYSFSVGCVQFQSTNGFFGLFDGEEVVCVRDDAGCVREIEVEIPRCIFDDCYEGRLVITPNGDGLNDNLIIKCAQNAQNILRIFNRGGQLVYQEVNYRNTWEGTSNSGSDLNEDTYLWVLEIVENNRVVDQFNGTVTILRELR